MKTQRVMQSKVSWLKRRRHRLSNMPKQRGRLYIAVGCIILAMSAWVFYAMGGWNAVSALMAMRSVEQRPAHPNTRTYTDASVTVTAGAGSFTISAVDPIDQRFEDGTRVELPRGAKLAVDYTPTQRLLRLLAGEVTVYVARDRHRPLSVQANEITATAVGTTFKVTLAATPRVHVIEGTVAVKDGPDANAWVVKLEAGQSYPSNPK